MKLLDRYAPVEIVCERHVERDQHPAGREAFATYEGGSPGTGGRRQHMRSLERWGWARSRARDYYDLWRILGVCRDRLDFSAFESFLHEKCALKGVTFSGLESCFPGSMLRTVGKTWKEWLGPLVPKLPPYQAVVGELRPKVAELLVFKK